MRVCYALVALLAQVKVSTHIAVEPVATQDLLHAVSARCEELGGIRVAQVIQHLCSYSSCNNEQQRCGDSSSVC
jgi:hypothetical protein